MAIEIACPGCKKRYRVKEELAGKALRCKACQSVVTIPLPTPEPAPLESLLDDEMMGLPSGEDPLAAGDPLGTPLSPAAPKRKARKTRSDFRLPELGIWWIAAGLLPIMLLLWPLGLVSKSAAGMLALLGLIIPALLAVLGLLGIIFGMLTLAAREGGNALFHVLLWTRAGRQFVYANWREYRTALFMFLQGIVVFLAGIGMTLTIGDRHRSSDSKTEVAQGLSEPDPMDAATDDYSTSDVGDVANTTGQPFDSAATPSAASGTGRSDDEPAQSTHEDARERSFQSILKMKRRPLEKEFGADRLATIIILGVPDLTSPFDLKDAVQENCGVEQVVWHSQYHRETRSQEYRLVVSPVDDLDAFATRITLGTVTSIDHDTRTVHVKAAPSRMPGAHKFGPPSRGPFPRR